jgi:hypothetical protein
MICTNDQISCIPAAANLHLCENSHETVIHFYRASSFSLCRSGYRNNTIVLGLKNMTAMRQAYTSTGRTIITANLRGESSPKSYIHVLDTRLATEEAGPYVPVNSAALHALCHQGAPWCVAQLIPSYSSLSWLAVLNRMPLW